MRRDFHEKLKIQKEGIQGTKLPGITNQVPTVTIRNHSIPMTAPFKPKTSGVIE